MPAIRQGMPTSRLRVPPPERQQTPPNKNNKQKRKLSVQKTILILCTITLGVVLIIITIVVGTHGLSDTSHSDTLVVLKPTIKVSKFRTQKISRSNFINIGNITGDYIHKTFGTNWNRRSTIRAIVNPSGNCIMMSNYYGTPIQHNRIDVSINGHTISSPTVSSPLIKPEGSYSIEVNYYKNGDNGILQRIANAGSRARVTVAFIGGAGNSRATQLSRADVAALVESVKFAQRLAR